MISAVEGGAFTELGYLQILDLGRNRLSKFNSDVFQGTENLEKLDLSENFITDFPTVALKSFAALKHLNLSSNMITVSAWKLKHNLICSSTSRLGIGLLRGKQNNN